jgi:PST family polysaccharide transporter
MRNYAAPLINKLKEKLSDRFIRNIGWLGGSELIIRVFRLATTVILARSLTPYDYGLAAIVMTTYELTRVFTENGISAKIIQVEQQELEALCNSAYWLNWVIYTSLFIIQCIVAFIIAWVYHDNRLILPICLTATIYLIIPIALVQAFLIYRENRLKIPAIINASQLSSYNVLAAIFALLGMGMWAIVLPSVLVAPIWLIINYKSHPWRPSGKFTTEGWGNIFHFGKNVLGVHLLKTIKDNLDYLIVGRFLGIEELGIYYFAFNAGLGISLNIIKSINSALLPHLCEARSDWTQFKQRYFSSIKTISSLIIPLVLLQSSLAPFYVPIVFGEKWTTAIPILILICLSAIPRPFADAASQLLLSVGKPHLDLRWNFIFTSVFIASLLIAVNWQSFGVALAVLLTHLILLPLFSIWATRHVFTKVKLKTS